MANEKTETTFTKVEDGDNKIKGAHPGSSIVNRDMSFEDLGDLLTFVPPDPDKEDEGTGEWVTILFDHVSGSDGKAHFKGEVLRFSKLITNYAPDDTTRASALRLLNMDAIRKSTPEEARNGVAIVTQASESPEVRQERALRMEAERQLMEFKQQAQPVVDAVPVLPPPAPPVTTPVAGATAAPATEPVAPTAAATATETKDALADEDAWK